MRNEEKMRPKKGYCKSCGFKIKNDSCPNGCEQHITIGNRKPLYKKKCMDCKKFFNVYPKNMNRVRCEECKKYVKEENQDTDDD